MTISFIKMDVVADLNKSHGVTARRQAIYRRQSASRHSRMVFGGKYGIDTDIIHNDGQTLWSKLRQRQRRFCCRSGLAEEIEVITDHSHVSGKYANQRDRPRSGLMGCTVGNMPLQRNGWRKAQRGSNQGIGTQKPSMEMTTEDRADAWLDFTAVS